MFIHNRFRGFMKSLSQSKLGKFITLEGGEGGGKTTNIEFISQLLDEAGIPFVITREPGGTPLAEEIRELLLAKREEPVEHLTELLLIFAARSQHLYGKIIPALEKGIWVISDRFTDATYAYQGGGRGMDLADIAMLESWVQKEIRPDCTLILDLPVEMGMQRASKRGELDRFEEEKLDFFSRIRDCYLKRANANPDRYKVIDASKPLTDVQQSVGEVMSELIAEFKR